MSLYTRSCFHDVQTDVPNYDYTYCVGNLLIMVLAAFNTCIFTYVFVVHIQQKRRLEEWKSILLKVKTQTLILIIFLEATVFVRYLLDMRTSIYDTLLILDQLVQSVILFQICYFYCKKAAHFLEDGKRIR